MAFSPTIVTSAHYDAIRDLLGVTTNEVSDAIIIELPFLPMAEAEVKQAITNYAAIKTEAGDDYTRLVTAVCALTAVQFCPRLETWYNDQLAVGNFKVGSAINWRKKAEDILSIACRAMDGISTRTTRTYRTLMYLAGPARSGSREPEDIDEWIERILPEIVNWVETDPLSSTHYHY